MTILLMATLLAGAIAGVPLHAGEEQSTMMECCAMAQEKDGSPESIAAQVCCVVECPLPAESSTTNPFKLQESSKTSPANPPVRIQPFGVTSDVFQAHQVEHISSIHAPPIYILHLALLI